MAYLENFKRTGEVQRYGGPVRPVRPGGKTGFVPGRYDISRGQLEHNKWVEARNAALMEAGMAEIDSSGPEGQARWAAREKWLADYNAANPEPYKPPSYATPRPGDNQPVRPWVGKKPQPGGPSIISGVGRPINSTTGKILQPSPFRPQIDKLQPSGSRLQPYGSNRPQGPAPTPANQTRPTYQAPIRPGGQSDLASGYQASKRPKISNTSFRRFY